MPSQAEILRDAAAVRPKRPEPPKMRVVTKGWWVREEAPQPVETLREQDRKLWDAKKAG